jgi:tetratricopeptide (TPR) repeat protein
MSMNGENGRRSGRLDSWKEIAQFFGRDERTVRRWEERRGLPVRRVPGGGKTTVYAFAEELQAWLNQSGVPVGTDETSAAPMAEPLDQDASPVFARADRTLPERVRTAGAAGHMRMALLIVSIIVVAALAATSWIPSTRARHTNSTAYNYYLKGEYSWQTRTSAGLTQAIVDFNKSIGADPNYARAWAGLADCYNLMPEYGAMPAAIAFPRAAGAARRALQLDNSLADAHRDIAFVDFWWSHNVAEAMREFRRSLELDPRSAQGHHWYATALGMIGDDRGALAQIGDAEELAPGSTAVLLDKGLLLADAGHFEEGLQILKQVEIAEPNIAQVHTYLSAVYHFLGNGHAALEEMQRSAALAHDTAGLAIAAAGEEGYRGGGVQEMVRRVAAEEQQLYDQGKLSPYALAQAYALLGERDRAFPLLTEAVDRRESRAMALRIERDFRSLHGDSRFAPLLAREGLPPVSTN